MLVLQQYNFGDGRRLPQNEVRISFFEYSNFLLTQKFTQAFSIRLSWAFFEYKIGTSLKESAFYMVRPKYIYLSDLNIVNFHRDPHQLQTLKECKIQLELPSKVCLFATDILPVFYINAEVAFLIVSGNGWWCFYSKRANWTWRRCENYM